MDEFQIDNGGGKPNTFHYDVQEEYQKIDIIRIWNHGGQKYYK